MNLEKAILTFLTENPLCYSAKQIHEHLAINSVIDRPYTRVDINKILYSLQGRGVVVATEDRPALWCLSTHLRTTIPSSIPIVLVDLGNVHDILPKIEPYSKKGLVKVFAFADLAFNGVGVNPKVDPSITVFQSSTPDRNAADLYMIWKVAEICLKNTSPSSDIFIVTRDQGFRTLETIAKGYGRKITFLTTWEELRNAIE